MANVKDQPKMANVNVEMVKADAKVETKVVLTSFTTEVRPQEKKLKMIRNLTSVLTSKDSSLWNNGTSAVSKHRDLPLKEVNNKDPKANPARVVSNKNPKANPTRVVSNKNPKDNPTRVVSNKNPKANPARVVSNKDQKANPARVVSNKNPKANPARVVSNKNPKANPARVVSNKDPKDNPTKVVNNKNPRAKTKVDPKAVNKLSQPTTDKELGEQPTSRNWISS
jgi:hypothetical protein